VEDRIEGLERPRHVQIGQQGWSGRAVDLIALNRPWLPGCHLDAHPLGCRS
jgi:hypothetical protein